jgi:hypothetical protein
MIYYCIIANKQRQQAEEENKMSKPAFIITPDPKTGKFVAEARRGDQTRGRFKLLGLYKSHYLAKKAALTHVAG